MSKATTTGAGVGVINTPATPVATPIVPPTPLAELPTVEVVGKTAPAEPVVLVQPSLTFWQKAASCCRGFSSAVLIPIAIQATDTGEDIVRNVINTYIDSKSNLSPEAKALAKQANIAACKTFETAVINYFRSKQTEWAAEAKGNKLVQDVAAVVDQSGIVAVGAKELAAVGGVPGATHVTTAELTAAGLKAADTAGVMAINAIPAIPALSLPIQLKKEDIATIVQEAVRQAGFDQKVADRILDSEAGKAAVYRMIQNHNENVAKIAASTRALATHDGAVGVDVDHSDVAPTSGPGAMPLPADGTQVAAAHQVVVTVAGDTHESGTNPTPDGAHALPLGVVTDAIHATDHA